MRQQANRGSGARNDAPRPRRLFDETLDPRRRIIDAVRGPAAPSRGGARSRRVEVGVRPFELVGLVADGEIEAPQAEADRVAMSSRRCSAPGP